MIDDLVLWAVIGLILLLFVGSNAVCCLYRIALNKVAMGAVPDAVHAERVLFMFEDMRPLKGFFDIGGWDYIVCDQNGKLFVVWVDNWKAKIVESPRPRLKHQKKGNEDYG